MEQLGGGATRFRHQQYRRSPPASDRFLGTLKPQLSSSAASQLELSEHDIFSTPSGGSSPSPAHQYFAPNPGPGRNVNRNHYGILAALNGSIKSQSRSGSGTQPVFNHKASASASLSSSSSTSSAKSTSSRITIPRPPPPQADAVRFRHQSAPVNVPVNPEALRRRAMKVEDALSEGEEEEEHTNGVVLPPHEVVAARHSPLLASSVLEGAGRTLKGRDLRQVRNAIWRKTGFID